MNGTVRSVEKAFQMLDSLIGGKPEQSLGELAAALGIPKSTAHQILRSLCKSGIVEQAPESRGYRLGPKSLQLGSAYLRRLNLLEYARPHMRALWERCQETVVLSRLLDNRRAQIAVLESPHELRYSPRLGDSAPLHRGASGKAILAFLPRERQVQVLSEYLSAAEIPSALKDLEKVATIGVAWSFGERLPGFTCIAAPIWNWLSQVEGCLSIAGPSARFPNSNAREYETVLLEAAARISRSLGAEAAMSGMAEARERSTSQS